VVAARSAGPLVVFDAEASPERTARAHDPVVQATWAKQIPEAVECLNTGFAAATRYFAFPKAHWKRIRSTNGIERLHGEIKRRIRAVGAFPDRTSALRLVTAVTLHATAIWSDRRYLDMDLLNAKNEDLRRAA